MSKKCGHRLRRTNLSQYLRVNINFVHDSENVIRLNFIDRILLLFIFYPIQRLHDFC